MPPENHVHIAPGHIGCLLFVIGFDAEPAYWTLPIVLAIFMKSALLSVKIHSRCILLGNCYQSQHIFPRLPQNPVILHVS